jgi:hypothetical protein
MGCTQQVTKSEVAKRIPHVAKASGKSFQTHIVHQVGTRANVWTDPNTVSESNVVRDETISMAISGDLIISYQKSSGRILSFANSKVGTQTQIAYQKRLIGAPLQEKEYVSIAREFLQHVFLRAPSSSWSLSPQNSNPKISVSSGTRTVRWTQFNNGFPVRIGNTCHVSMRVDTGEIINATFHDLHVAESPVVSYTKVMARDLAVQTIQSKGLRVIQVREGETAYYAQASIQNVKYKPLVLCHPIDITTSDNFVHCLRVLTRTGQVIDYGGYVKPTE